MRWSVIYVAANSTSEPEDSWMERINEEMEPRGCAQQRLLVVARQGRRAETF